MHECYTPVTPLFALQLFAKYCSGELASNPWSEVIEGGLHRETQKINERLIALNSSGLLTINSQPAVNGAPSADADVGEGHNSSVP